MVIAPFFLNTEEIGKRIIESSFYIAFVGPTISDISRNGPSFIIESASISVHSAQRVVAVSSRQSYSLSRCHRACSEIIVITSCKPGYGKVAVFERQGEINVASLPVQTAHHGIVEQSAFHIVHRSAVDVNFIIL